MPLLLWRSCLLLQHFFTCSPIREGLQQFGACCDGRTAARSLHEACSGRWDGSVEVLLWPFPFLLVGVRKLSMLAERDRLTSRGILAVDVAQPVGLALVTVACFFLSHDELSVYGAVADSCAPNVSGLRGVPAAPKHLEKVKISTVLSKAEHSPNEQWRNLRQEYEQKFELCSETGLKLVELKQYFYTLETEEGQQMQHLCREYTLPLNEKETRVRGWIRSKTRIGPASPFSIARQHRFVGQNCERR